MKVAILTRGPGNYTSQRLKEELVKRGHKSMFVNHAKCYVDIEQNNPDVRYEGKDISNLDAIIPRIGNSITMYGSAIVRQFEMRGVYTTARSIAISRSRDKLRSLQLLSKSGVGIPKTIFARETAEVEDLLDQVGGVPVIIKVARGTHGRGVVLAETRKAAKSVIQAFYVEGVNFMIQEFIEEAAGTDIRAFVVGGRVVGAMQRQSLDDDFRSNLHLGGHGTVAKLTDEEKKTAIKAAKAMGLAICGVDMIRSNRGPLVMEVNSSPGIEGLEKATGKNIAGKMVEYIEHNAKRKQSKDKVGA
jgi:ribosomal protein S6--L-glutamate ligase